MLLGNCRLHESSISAFVGDTASLGHGKCELVLPSGNGWLLIAGQIACTSARLLSEFSLEAQSYMERAKALLITIATVAASVPSLGANSNW